MTQETTTLKGLPFLKMHGLGNHFVIVDARGKESPISPNMARGIGDGHFGVGFDQLAVLTDSQDADVDIAFWNADGSTANACGNASRCIAQILMEETGKDHLILRTGNGLLPAIKRNDGLISVNMGQPVLNWQDIPLACDVDLNALPLDGSPSAIGMGNPHCVFVVEDADGVDVASIGSKIEHDPLFPERTNVEFVSILDRKTIRQRTWERGAGITLACGSGACAVAVACHRKGLTDRNVNIHLDGGLLEIDWREDGVWMTGPATLVFEGVLSSEFLAGL